MRLRICLLFCLVIPLLTGWGHWGPKVKIGFSLDQARGREPLVDRLREETSENRGEFLMEDAKGDPAIQEAQVRDLIRQGIQALVVLPCDPSKAASLVSEAHQAGIKVISLERLIPGSGLDYLVAFDNVRSGELQAQALVRKVPKGRYVLLEDVPVSGVSKDLREGQMKILQPLINRGDIRIVASPWKKTPGAGKGMNTLPAGEKNRVEAVLASDNAAAEWAVQALQKAGLSGKVPVAGIGQDLASCRRIASGTQWMTIYHPPSKLAEEAAYLAAKLARKATQFDCQFTEVGDGPQKTLAVLLTPLAVDAGNLDSTVISDKVQKHGDVYGK